ncbi:hypothetical protein [Acidisphaera sp. S103]|uniref:hypothetical protein n=1 Tax=Acidisphaera sp. S103 TaxID=1747223 RepID=UPI00131D2E92|nr:hypothetical protein [Acidisphaera sp. S103]
MFWRPIAPGISISQAGFGAATGGTLGCFVEDKETKKIMLLSNMHVLQFFQSPPSFFYATPRPQSQLDIVQPCAIELKEFAEQSIGRDKKAVWLKGHPPPKNPSYGTFSPPTTDPQKPSEPITQTDIDKFYLKTLNEFVASAIEKCTVAKFERGFLETNFDAAVATLKPGVQWTNATLDGTQILAPPPVPTPGGPVWKYGDASGIKKWGIGMVSQDKVKVPFKTFNNDSMLFGPIDPASKQLPVEFNAGQVWKITGTGGGTFQIQGDSGSALCDQHNRLIGLMSAGGVGPTAYAIPIDVIFSKLNVSFPGVPSGTA